MYEFVYKLNLPPIKELLISNFLPKDDDKVANYELFDNIRNHIKHEYLKQLGIDTGRILYFKKSNILGTIHTDTGHDHETRDEWAFNWILNANRILEYWNWKDVEPVGNTATATNSKHGSAVMFRHINPPCSTYVLKANCVYLVQTSNPHRAYGFKYSKAISLRPYTYYKSWTQVIEEFKNTITN